MSKPLSFATIEAIGSPKNKRKKVQNIFKLTPISTVFYKEPITVNFQSKKQASSGEQDFENEDSKCYIEQTDKDKVQELSITPKFNFDSKHYTSSFIIPYEGKECDEEMQIFHINRTYESQRHIDHSNILIPKPKSRNQYCAVCRYHYEDYLEHINDYEHKKNIHKNRFNQDIMCLAKWMKDKLQHSHEKDGVMTRSAKRRLEIISSQHIQLEMKISKKRKNQKTFNYKPAIKSVQEREEADGQTPFNRKWHYETTAKSVYSALD